MSKEYNDALIDKINLIIKRKKITKIALAEKLNINPNTLSNYLLKKRAIPYGKAIELIKMFDIDVVHLHSLTDSPIDLEVKEAYEEFKEKLDDIYKNSTH